MGKGGGGGSSSGNQPAGGQTTTTTNNPWAGQQPYLTDVYGKAQNIGNTPLQYFPGQTYANPTAQQNAAVGLTTNRALNGSPVMGAADNNAVNTLSGNYLSAGNPYFSNMVSQLGQTIQPQIDSQFEASGRGAGSGANANAFANAMANASGNLAFQNYGQERGLMNQASFQAPTLANNDYVDLQNLGVAGAQQQAFNQLPITQAINRYNFNQDAPYIQANRMAGLIGGAIPGGGTSGTSYYTAPPNQVAQGLSLGQTGMGLFGK